MKSIKNKGFTLIELLVTIAVLGVLVLLASPRFFGHTQNAELTRGFANARSIEKASELYYMDHEDWPRLTDEPYTSEEIESYSERILDRTGHEVNLDAEGNYYDIDYDKLSDYIQVPDDKKNYILQNPVGKVFYMDNLNETGIARVDYSNAKEEDDNPKVELMNPIESRKPIEGEEIAIDSADELAKIGQTGYPLNGKYILIANIDLSKNENWTPIGSYTDSTNKSPFTGSFDGNGYKITGLTINGSNYVGLFGYTEGATIRNVALEDINVNGKDYVGGLVGYANTSTEISNSYATGSVTGSSEVGGLVGQAYGSSTISNSYATGEVTGTSIQVGGLVGLAVSSTKISNSYATGSVTGSYYVGGLVGTAHQSSIENSYAIGSATGTYTSYTQVGGLVGYAYESSISNSYATGSVKGTGSSVGGLVGYAYRSTVTNSYSTGSVTGTGSYVGGLVGLVSDSTISNSYTTGSVTGGGSVGGLVGVVRDSTINNSYWDTKTTGRPSSAGGLGKTTDEMKEKTTYKGWGFDTVWKIDEGNDYPKLR